jgi:hypothetical protein
MPSSWNTGTRLESASKAVSQGPSFFDTVINNASQAMASGAEVVADAAEGAYELLPEADTIKESVSSMVSRIPEPNIPTFNMGAVGETVSNLNQQGQEFAESQKRKIDKYAELSTTTAAKLLLQDFRLFDFQKKNYTITEKDFKEDEIQFLKAMAKQYGAGLIEKDMYKGITFGDVRGGNVEKLSDVELSLADRVYNSLGNFTISKDEKTGEYFIDDVYDWNIYTDYTDESAGIDPETGRPKGKVYTTEQFEAKFPNKMEALLATWNSDASQFEKIHNTAFLFGSRDYKDNTKDTGVKIRINLGKLD